MQNFGTKWALYVFFWTRSVKYYCHISNYHLQISVIPKFREETKMLKFGNKRTRFGYIWVET